MVERCLIASSDISKLDVLNHTGVSESVRQMGTLKATRLIVTNSTAEILYDSMSDDTVGAYAIFPEILKALENKNIFTWDYSDGNMLSRAATPVYTHGTLSGCVYMMEYDAEQGMLIASLQRNILSITLVLEAAVILFSVFFSSRFSQRLRRIRSSMRIIRGGDYSHKVKIGGRDELTLLGREFNELTERLQTSEGKRRQFVSDASHELKTPLASIKLLSDSILQNDMDMETVREFVGDIGNEAERLNRMSTKLLSLSKIDSQIDEVAEIMELTPTLNRVVKMLTTIAAENSINVTLEIIQDSPILIREDDLYQIAFNLVENGIKYNRPGGKLIIQLSREAEDAVLTVSDTGVGIPDDAIPHLFERFFRVDKARSRKSGGSGLGLSIVNSLVQRNGGEISVESTPNEGSVFAVRFPVFDTEEELQ